MREQELRQIKGLLSREHDLKPKYAEGQQRQYRLWMTIDNLDPYGRLSARNQWRGDFERIVTSVSSSGRADEKITWKNVGFRSWLAGDNRYDAHQKASWAEGFSYRFSAEDNYSDLDWDFSQIPKDMLGFTFRGALQISAHVEFDFLRSSRHASIEKLRKAGDVLRTLPEEGEIFSLDFPPIFTNSRLERRNVQVGFLGLTLAEGEPCALLDYRQGPQEFSWNMLMSPDQPAVGMELISRQNGVFVVRLKDGSLLNGEFTELAISKMLPGAEGSEVAGNTIATWSIREIGKEEIAEGLAGWAADQSPTPRFRPQLEVPSLDSV